MRVDPRAGSKELVAPLRHMGVEVEELLIAADVEIIGLGTDGVTLVGVEYKTFEDVVQCVRNGRFADQLRRMRASYHVSWLLVEGRVRVDGRHLQVRRGEKWFTLPGGVTYQEMAAWLDTMVMCGGVLVWRTEDRAESVRWLRTLEMWWQKDWSCHSAHTDWYTPPLAGGNPFDGGPSLAQRWAHELPGIGGKKAVEVAKHFGSAKKLACASQEEWSSIPLVGKKGAAAVVAAIEKGGNDEDHDRDE